ncbi:MAG: FecR domain-containing protein [Phycisphaerae bacterium]|nr:FecR domain-containing protein [Phycisphaerae bacterium]
MNLAPIEKYELNELLGLLRDGQISDLEFLRLEEMMAQNPQAIDYYVEYVNLCADLTLNQNAVEIQQEPDSATILREVLENQVEEVDELSMVARPESEIVFVRKRSYLSKMSILQIVGAVAAVLAMAFLLEWISSISNRVSPPSVVTYAMITGQRDAVWQNNDLVQGDKLGKDNLFLKEGYVELTFDDGSNVVIEGPSTFSPMGYNELWLASGKASVVVDKNRNGFIVDTPHADILDLGTEFAVEVNEEQTTDLYVYKGIVQLQSKNALDSPIERISVCQARRINVGDSKIYDRDFRNAAFVRALPDKYELAVRKAKPILYWNFDDDFSCLTNVMDQEKAVARFFGNFRLVDGVKKGTEYNNALYFDGQSHMMVANTSMQLVKRNKNYTVAMWVRPEIVDKKQTILSMGVTTGSDSFVARRVDMLNNSFAMRFYNTGGARGTQIASNVDVAAGKWQMIVFIVADEGKLRKLYIDGFEDNIEDRTPNALPESNKENDKLIIGAFFGKKKITGASDYFKGTVDEISIFDRALSEDEIQELYKLANPGF